MGGDHGLPEPHSALLATFKHDGDAFCMEALEEALALHGRPAIFNTDQGSQFTSFDCTNVLKETRSNISMDGKGRWMENVCIERLWRSLQYECIYLNAFEPGLQARKQIGAWMAHDNHTRPHSTHHGQTPDEVYKGTKFSQGQAPEKWKEAA